MPLRVNSRIYEIPLLLYHWSQSVSVNRLWACQLERFSGHCLLDSVQPYHSLRLCWELLWGWSFALFFLFLFGCLPSELHTIVYYAMQTQLNPTDFGSGGSQACPVTRPKWPNFYTPGFRKSICLWFINCSWSSELYILFIFIGWYVIEISTTNKIRNQMYHISSTFWDVQTHWTLELSMLTNHTRSICQALSGELVYHVIAPDALPYTSRQRSSGADVDC